MCALFEFFQPRRRAHDVEGNARLRPQLANYSLYAGVESRCNLRAAALEYAACYPMATSIPSTFSNGLARSGKRQCVIFTAADGGLDPRLCPRSDRSRAWHTGGASRSSWRSEPGEKRRARHVDPHGGRRRPWPEVTARLARGLRRTLRPGLRVTPCPEVEPSGSPSRAPLCQIDLRGPSPFAAGGRGFSIRRCRSTLRARKWALSE